MSKRLALAAVRLLAGFLLGGLVGWSQRPAEWQAGIWQTAHVSVNAATYGHAYESHAERVLLYFIYGGILGTVVAGLLIAGLNVVINRLRGRRSPAP
jgi:uncharacterized membrane protein YhiD involved in acid resistance